MSTRRDRRNNTNDNVRRAHRSEPSAEARRKQVFVGLFIGALVGVVISLFTQFWLWLPAGLALGLTSGVMIKPPPGDQRRSRVG